MSLDLLRLQVSSGLVVAARHWRRICHMALTGHGISEACAAPLLMIVRLGDGVHQVAVAQAAGLESPSLVRLLDQLCRAGLVLRSEDPMDRRAKALSLTAEGRVLAEAIEAELVRVRGDVLSRLDPEDLQATLRVLRAFEAAGLGSTGEVA
ncbi:MarR family winged helix-turn-helix transcriptional regulator [Pseudomonas aeruginosa]